MSNDTQRIRDVAARHYGIDRWGKGYFDVNARGRVCVRPHGSPDRGASDEQQRGAEIDLLEVVEGLRARDIAAPLVLRFAGIVGDRMRRLAEAFRDAIEDNGYRNRYLAVYPIKVNQHRQVVEEIYRAGGPLGFGLEAGSKPELLAVLAMTGDAGERPIVCNGFKDDSYIELAVLASKLGRNIIPVVENFDELDRIIRAARKHDVRPDIGVRIKLGSQGAGRWAQSSGAKSKFGLTATQLLELVETLREAELLDCLKLVHCHPGSQLHDIRRIKDGIGELAHVYVALRRLGAPMGYIDVGGGLGVDYDGSAASHAASMNYSLDEYASAVVYRVGSVCDQAGVEHPIIVSESGRAMSAYSSVMVINVLGSATFERNDEIPDLDADDLPAPVADLRHALADLAPDRLVEVFHDVEQAYEQTLQLFKLGVVDLGQRALAERLYWTVCTRIAAQFPEPDDLPAELQHLPAVLSDLYFCNFSIFQSLPDAWAIDQLFPIMPIHRLDETPTRRGTLADITCDSDGKIDRFVHPDGIASALPLHPVREGEPYYLAAFLIGAYQETLGDLHNLFGDTHVVTIEAEGDGGWSIEEVVKGDTAAALLQYMQFRTEEFRARFWRDCEQAVKAGRLSLEDSQQLRRFYERELEAYSYLELS